MPAPALDPTRCCFCRETDDLEPGGWPLPPDSQRCTDHSACAARVKALIAAHRELAQVCQQ